MAAAETCPVRVEATLDSRDALIAFALIIVPVRLATVSRAEDPHPGHDD